MIHDGGDDTIPVYIIHVVAYSSCIGTIVVSSSLGQTSANHYRSKVVKGQSSAFMLGREELDHVGNL
jgi:hypothetical protein